MAEVNVPKKRRLTDLYQKGKYATLNDDSDEAEGIQVYIAKINDLDQKKAVEKSGAARAKHLIMMHDKSDPGRAYYVEQLNAFDADDPDNLISLIIQPKLAEAEMSAEAEIASMEEWSENGYLESLQESWNGGLAETFEVNPEDEDAARVYKELLRFAERVEAEVQSSRKDLVESYAHRSYEELLNLAVDRLIDIDASTAWLDEFNRWRIFYSVRDPENHKERYFESREEVDQLDSEIISELINHYDALTVSAQEGKD